MRSTTLFFTIIAFFVATVVAARRGTNAERMARGLPPRAPRKLYRQRATPASPARRSQPSGTPSDSTCATGPLQCCSSVVQADSDAASIVAEHHDINLPDTNVLVGLTCSAITDGGSPCSADTVCCSDNSYGGVLAIGCTYVTPS